MWRRTEVILTLAVLSISSAAGQDNWPQFRGPNADGVAADDPRLPDSWSTEDNVAWVADVPGYAWACPVVWENRVFVSTVVSDAENEKPKKNRSFCTPSGLE